MGCRNAGGFIALIAYRCFGVIGISNSRRSIIDLELHLVSCLFLNFPCVYELLSDSLGRGMERNAVDYKSIQLNLTGDSGFFLAVLWIVVSKQR